jgi:hypothetical protein
MRTSTTSKRLFAPTFGALAAFGAALALVSPACEVYDSPPRPSIDGLVDGVLTDPKAPLVLRFSEPIVADSLKVKIVKLTTDEEGNLGDEDDDDATELFEFFGYDPISLNNFGGAGTLSDDGTEFRIDLATPLPIGPSLALLLEPGLSDLEGNTVDGRSRLVFGYQLSCDEAGNPTTFPSGTYFFLVDVAEPISTQVQLWASLDVDPATGRFVGQFTNADRNRDGARCSPACSESEACRLLPTEECVIPSTKAGTEDEYPDFVVNDVLPSGYSFPLTGCIVDDGNTIAFVNEPGDIDIQQPAVFVQGIQLTASFADEGGSFRGSGGITAEQILIGETPSGTGSGTMRARLVPEGEVPAGVPQP